MRKTKSIRDTMGPLGIRLLGFLLLSELMLVAYGGCRLAPFAVATFRGFGRLWCSVKVASAYVASRRGNQFKE